MVVFNQCSFADNIANWNLNNDNSSGPDNFRQILLNKNNHIIKADQ